MMEEDEKLPGIQAYHGSPHDFDQFDLSKIGTGEGAQAFGHGLYFAQHEPVAEGYRDELSKNKPLPLKIDDKTIHEYTPMQRMVADRFGNVDKVIELMSPKWESAEKAWHSIPIYAGDLERGLIETNYKKAQKQRAELEEMRGKNVGFGKRGHMYEVNIAAHPDHFLDWDKLIYQQPEHIQNAVHKALTFAIEQAIDGKKSLSGRSVDSKNNIVDAHPDEFLQHDGSTIQYMLQRVLGSKGASEALNTHGIKGIKYLDAGSRGKDEGSRNYVVFDDRLVNINRKYAHGGDVE